MSRIAPSRPGRRPAEHGERGLLVIGIAQAAQGRPSARPVRPCRARFGDPFALGGRRPCLRRRLPRRPDRRGRRAEGSSAGRPGRRILSARRRRSHDLALLSAMRWTARARRSRRRVTERRRPPDLLEPRLERLVRRRCFAFGAGPRRAYRPPRHVGRHNPAHHCRPAARGPMKARSASPAPARVGCSGGSRVPTMRIWRAMPGA